MASQWIAKSVSRQAILSLVNRGVNKAATTYPLDLLASSCRYFCPFQNHQSKFHSSTIPFSPETPKYGERSTVSNSSSEDRRHSESSPGGRFHPPHPTVLHTLRQIEDSMRFYGYSTIRIGGVILIVGGFVVYISREYLRDKAADEVSTVAYKSLGDANVKLKAQELAVALLHAILDDENTQAQTVKFLKDLFGRPDTQKALSGLLLSVVNDPQTKSQLVTLLQGALISSLSDPQFRENLTVNLKILLQDPNTQEGVLSVLKYALSDDSLAEEAKTFLRKLIESMRVRNAAVHLGKKVVEGVVSDDSIQRQTGQAMWGSMSYSVTPQMFWGKSSEQPSPPALADTSTGPANNETSDTSSKQNPEEYTDGKETVSVKMHTSKDPSGTGHIDKTSEKEKKNACNERNAALAAVNEQIEEHKAENLQENDSTQ